MKKAILIIVGIIFVLALAGFGFYQYVNKQLENLPVASDDTIVLSELPDGTYQGAYNATIIDVEVEVVVLDNEITAITITKHLNGQGASGEAITVTVIQEQSVEVDVIAGATYSSKVILLAIMDALAGN